MVSPARLRAIRLATSVGCLFGIVSGTLQAQTQRNTVPRVARRDSEDLSKFLIETEKRNVGDSFFNSPSTIDANRINMSSVRTLLDQFADGANRLYRAIDAETQYNPRLRAILSDAMKLRARATMLSQDAQSSRDLTLIAASVREIDSDWRLLSHNIKRMPQVPRSVLAIVTGLDRIDEQIERAFQIEPQFDRRELLTQVMAMGADFNNLIDDIELEMGMTAEARELIRGVRSIRTQAAYSADLIAERGDYKRIVEAYQRAEADWEPIAKRLASVNNRYIDRSVRRIVSAGNTIKQLLWLDNEADISELINTANSMRANVDEFFKRTPLLLMVKLENPQLALRAANSFYDACDVYTEQVRDNADIDTLMEVFKDLETTGHDFLKIFSPLPSRQGQLVLSDINRDLASLQELAQSHYGGDGFDLIAATNIAAEMETLAEHIDFDLRQWLRQSNDPQSRAALQLSAQFKANTRQLSNSIAVRRPREEIRTLTAKVYEDWRRIDQVLRRAPEEDRLHMASISSKLTSALYDLMLPLGL